MTIRYGLIGSGMMGLEHIRNINLLDGAEVAAIADPDEGMRGQAQALVASLGGNTEAFADHRQLLDSASCDAYLIASPNDTHRNILLDILPAGKPILCEKPLCSTFAHCEEVKAAAPDNSQLWVAMEYRYMPPIQHLLELCEAGVAGKTPRMLAIREHRYPFLAKVDNWNRFNTRTGGTMVEKCCHFWDLMRLILKSDPIRVFASAGCDVNHQEECYAGKTPDMLDNGFVVVDFESGSRAMLDLCMFAEGSHWQEVVSLTGDSARIDACVPGPARFAKGEKNHDAVVVVSERSSGKVTETKLQIDETILHAGDHHGSTFFQHQHFLRMVRDGGEPQVGMDDGAWAVRIGEAAEHSARSGQAVDLGNG